jgi:hypothetical protein
VWHSLLWTGGNSNRYRSVIMASSPDSTPVRSGNLSQPAVESAQQLNADLEELQAKFARLMHESQELLRKLNGAPTRGPT